ncbi:hypothetical protein [Chryseobacterium gallinarum]|uniref:YHYH domain-containing protein n=1 Tax=Chryseobacterium gallinarum TaxID=1324352 RepID=A0ABX6KTT8_CHRGL|nr:hypothetical protein [Chryseobacterium gallinarum]MCL8537062.1 hypothetical protein [Chryseobacterium gallinarum]QIY90849.1 hypothetical protein FOB44_09345 [Chryseobacterium gallinarum]
MIKKLMIKIALLVTVLMLFSCMHDEVYSASEATFSREYSSKSLWKEDEKYIGNVKKVFDQYADKNYFTAKYGTVLWDYALTMGTFDESFLEVPVSENGKIKCVLTAERRGNKVYFRIKNEKNSNDFFDVLVFKERSQLKGNIRRGNSGTSSRSNCYTVTVTWTWTSETTGEVLQVDTYTKTHCTPSGPVITDPVNPNDCLEENCTGGGSGGGDGGYPYPQDTPDNPCDKTKAVINNPKIKPAIDSLKKQSKKGGEIGYKFKPDGTPSGKLDDGKAHSINFGDKTGYVGGYHNHTPTGIPMFSAPDIDQLLGFARAQPTWSDNTGNAYMGMVAPNGMHYVMWFNGTYQDAITNFSQEQLNNYSADYRELEKNLTDFKKNGTTYTNADGSINNLGVEKLFFITLKNMGLAGKVKLQRVKDIENTSLSTVKSIDMNSNNEIISADCPQ